MVTAVTHKSSISSDCSKNCGSNNSSSSSSNRSSNNNVLASGTSTASTLITDELYAGKAGREQCPQVKVTLGVVFDTAPASPLLLSFIAILLSCSNSLTTLKIEYAMRHGPPP